MHKTAGDIAAMKGSEKISAVTAYDYTMASLCDGAGVDVMLVGDSAGMVMLGYDSTVPVTMEQMCMFTGAVSRARESALVVADLPFMSYQTGAPDAVANSGRLVRAGGDAVKLEGGAEAAGAVESITRVGIPVMGHIGLQPQTAALAGGYRAQGRTAESARGLIDDARALEEAGAFSLVLEMVSDEAAGAVSRAVSIPTIGIGSGAYCDGQVLVAHDLLGMYDKMSPRFVKRYAALAGDVTDSVRAYVGDVKAGRFPEPQNCFPMDREELRKLDGARGG